MSLTLCVGGRHKGKILSQKFYEKLNPKSKILVEKIKG